MDVEIFTICDAATISGGKLNILGSFDQLYSAFFPFQHPDCTVAAKLRFDASEVGLHQVEVRVIDLDGRKVVPSEPVPLHVVAPEGRTVAHMLITRHNGLPFARPGEYVLDLVVDGEVRASVPLLISPYPEKAV